MPNPEGTVLVIDDEDDLRMLLEVRLKRAGYRVVTASDGKDGLRLFYEASPDLVLLDVAMPVMDGWQVLERLREVSDVPVVMLTAAAQERDKVMGLKNGADDYITKPFSKDELLARVEAAVRRSRTSSAPSEGNTYGDLELAIDFPRHEVVVRGESVDLSPTEFRLLAALTRHEGQVLSQNQILDQVWGEAYAESIEVVRLYVGYLRRKIERDPGNPTLIENVRGFGYRYRQPAP
jgi:DNA-binding response OmpR family regulator